MKTIFTTKNEFIQEIIFSYNELAAVMYEEDEEAFEECENICLAFFNNTNDVRFEKDEKAVTVFLNDKEIGKYYTNKYEFRFLNF